MICLYPMSKIYISHGGIQLHTFASYALPCQTSFFQTSPLLSSVAQHQNVTEYWQECSTSTAISHRTLTSKANIMKLEALFSEVPSYNGLITEFF